MIDSPLVSVIVPVYNKQETVARTIDSIMRQTYKNLEVIVVDDGSTDSSPDVVADLKEKYPEITYVRQENSGVAIARNNGVFNYASGHLVLCLDADDAIGSEYLELLVPALWKDRDLGVVYTSLMNINPDGTEKVSPWPSKFDARAHFYERFNQVPTAALARYEVWERLGGQRQRYAPRGAGAEDGDFWLRAGTYGFGIKFIPPKSRESMFLYSTMQGNVSGNKSYQEVDWRSWSPWTKNPDLMPVASVAPSQRFSHPARRYDEPTVSVIIPVGPGHSKYLVDSLDSLDAQTLKKWEAIVVFDIDKPEWKELKETGQLEYIERTWPFCRFTSTHADGSFARDLVDTLDVAVGEKSSLLAGLPAGKPRGAGVARNAGVRAASAPLVIFLDADDYFMPDTLKKMVSLYTKTKHIIFADHYGVAPIEKDKLDLVLGELVNYNEKTGIAVIKQGVSDYDCRKALEQPYTDGRPPYIICNVSSLIPKKWVLDLGGFPENLSSWEDVLFWWKASWKGYCFSKVKEPLLVYRYHTGLRREFGRKNAKELLKYMQQVKAKLGDMGCGCGKSPEAGTIIDSFGNTVNSNGESGMATLRLSRGSQLAVDDVDLLVAVFEPPDRGDKMRYGQHDFGGGNFISYGRLSGGEQILVHRKDVEAETGIARAQGRDPIYRLVEEPVLSKEDHAADIEEIEPPKEIMEAAFAEPDEEDVDIFPPRLDGEYPPRLTPLEDLALDDLHNPAKYIGFLQDAGVENAFQIVKWNEEHEDGLQAIDGIGPKAAKAFTDAAAALV